MGNDCQWLICYRASVHGWSARSFHNKCDGKNNTVTIIQNGIYVFGGYTDIPWGEIVLTSSRIRFLCLGFVLFVCLFFNDILPGEMAKDHGAALMRSNGISCHEVRSVAGTNEFVKRAVSKAIMMHSIVNNTAPEYLTSRFVRRCDLTSYNLRENEYKLAFPRPRTEFYKRSLSYSGSVLWNGLPLEVRQLTSPSIFKGKLRDINLD